MYILSARKGVWPVNGMCRVFSPNDLGDVENYRVDVKFYNPMGIVGEGRDYFGIIFNAANYSNHDFVFYR